MQLEGIKATLVFMSLNLWIQHLARISLPWWSTPCTIHNFTLCKPQIMWYVTKSQSTSIHVYQINVESEINVLHIKSPFWCSLGFTRLVIVSIPASSIFQFEQSLTPKGRGPLITKNAHFYF